MKRSANTKAIHKKAFFNYDLKEQIEAGLVLTGPEIKAIRAGKVDLSGSHIRIISGEAYLLGSQINALGGDNTRTRKLLLHKEEISRLVGKSEEKGLTIVPVKIYLKRGRAKLGLSLGRGRKLHDKREALKKKDQLRQERQSFKNQ